MGRWVDSLGLGTVHRGLNTVALLPGYYAVCSEQ